MTAYALRSARPFVVRETLRRPRPGHVEPDSNTHADPYADADALDELADEIATLAAHIHAATQRLLELIAEFDRRRGWELGGHRSCAHWLALRTGIDLGAAREKVRTARALDALPLTRASMARGELSFSAVRALSRVATPDNEEDLLELATGCTTAQIERMVRGWKRASRCDEAELERERHESRCLSVFPDDEGMYVVKGRLPAEVGVLLMRALEAASDALYRERVVDAEEDADTVRAARQRRADAIGLLAERAMAVGFGRSRPREVRDEARDEVGREGGDDGGREGGGRFAAADAAPISGTRAERYQVVLHVDGDTLSAEEEPGRSELEDGTRVSAETSRRISCDAGLVRITRRGRERSEARDGHDGREGHHGYGAVLDVGRRTRTVPPALRRALDARDRGCRFPGCGMRFTDAHHVRHWADGGETSLGNCVLLCRHHHRLVHEGGWQVHWWGEGRPVFFDPQGGTHFDGRFMPPELPKHPVEALVGQNCERGVDPDGWTAAVRWKREADIPDHVYLRASEAMDRAGVLLRPARIGRFS